MTIYDCGKFLLADVLVVYLLVTKKGCRILAFFVFLFFCGRRMDVVCSTCWGFDFTLVCLSHAPTACGSILQIRVKSFIFNTCCTIYYFVNDKGEAGLANFQHKQQIYE
jgi:hypothetical protein